MRLMTVTTESTPMTHIDGGHAIREGADHEEHDALGAFHEADLALLISDSARARV
jgi:hypothetical protein